MTKRGKSKQRRCRSCGEVMQPGRLWLCDSCQAAGMGYAMTAKGRNNGKELLEVARERYRNPLEGMTAEEIECLSHEFLAPYNTYGKLRGYVYATGKLPGREMERNRG